MIHMNKPKIRFKGFTEDWEQRKFDDLADYKKGPFGSAITKDMFVPQSDDSIKVYEQQNAINKDWSLARYFLPKEYALTKLKSFEVHGGDIIVSCAGTIGEIYEIPENADSGIINQALMRVRVNEDIVDKKMFVIAFSNMIDAFTRTHSNGSAIKNIPPFADLKPMEVLMPSIAEQKKISGYFATLDHLITLHQRKKRRIYTTLTIVWEQRKLETVATFSKGSGYSKGDLQEVGTPIILYGRLYTKYETTISEVDTFVNEKSGSVYSKGGEVIIPASGETAEDIARAATVENKGILLGGDLNVITPDENVDSAFLALSISNGAAHKELASKAQGKSVVHIHNAEIQALNIAFPSKSEQSRISGYFANLDHLITLHQWKCEKSRLITKNDWEQRKLDDIYGSIGNAFVGTASPYYVESGHFYLESNNIKDGQINHNTEVFINDEFYEKQKDKWLHTGDMVMVQSGHVGHAAVIPEELNNSAAHALIMFRNPKEEIEPYFLNYQYQTLKSKKKIENITTGNTIKHILASEMQQFEVDMPEMAEQKKIAEYFRGLDTLITLHQRKCDETQKLKKYMLQKMFPKNGATVPEIRFSGFTEDWEQRKFSEVFDGLQNNTLSRAELNDESGQALNVHYGDILVKFGDWLDVSKEQLPFITDGAVVDKYKASFLQDGDIIIADTAEDSTAGKCTEIAGSEGLTLISGLHTIPCRPKEKFAPKYLGYYMNSVAYHTQLIPLMQGIKVTSISKSAMQNTDLVYPSSMDEQAKIGEYFDAIDHLITLHQRKCKELQNMKKFMLQNMFV